MPSAMTKKPASRSEIGLMAGSSTWGGYRPIPTLKRTLNEFLFVNDCTLSMNRFSTACRHFGLTISTKKTEVLHQPAPQKTYTEPTIVAEGEIPKAVDKFTYLGSTLSRSVNIDDEVDTCIAKASSAFGQLQELVWERRGVKLSTKLKMYKAVILPTLLYACGAWTVYECHANKLNRFYMNCLRRLLKNTWQAKVPDTDVLSQAGLPSIYTLLWRAQVSWAGHLVRMPDIGLPKRLFYEELVEGKHTQGEQKKCFKDTLKVSLKSFGTDPESGKILVQIAPPGKAVSAKVLPLSSRAGL
ncbi:hypothetical protein NDU88_011971 [Pleurodeles waltl]|uniref:Reverse transcriptase n=1 Tax=Pleurodeles waltl TaxID=8319 RepID=A0AAV7S6Z1_PLEWA|nr:hypothetical protein NDU88_011971 [Pleurodeles waltl]